jgi:intracellular sulfur oxidation DsrE/DsrF family protein
MAPLRLLLHAPTEAALIRAQANARNLLKLEPAARIEIVVNASAAAAALLIEDDDIRSRLVLCQNSLARQGLKAPGAVRLVPAAVQHLAQRQRAGWAYIRA